MVGKSLRTARANATRVLLRAEDTHAASNIEPIISRHHQPARVRDNPPTDMTATPEHFNQSTTAINGHKHLRPSLVLRQLQPPPSLPSHIKEEYYILRSSSTFFASVDPVNVMQPRELSSLEIVQHTRRGPGPSWTSRMYVYQVWCVIRDPGRHKLWEHLSISRLPSPFNASSTSFGNMMASVLSSLATIS